MAKRTKTYINKNVTKSLGELLRGGRIIKGYSLGDMEQMTGFPKSTILNIERGISTNINYYVAFGQAIEMAVLNNIELDLKPRYELTPERKNRLFLTLKVKDLLNNESFFEANRTVSDVIIRLSELNKISEANSKEISTSISGILLNLVEDGLLKVKEKRGRNNVYVKA